MRLTKMFVAVDVADVAVFVAVAIILEDAFFELRDGRFRAFVTQNAI